MFKQPMMTKLSLYIRTVRPEDAAYLIFISFGSIILASWFSPAPFLLSSQILIVMALYSFYSFSINNLFDHKIDRTNPLKRNKNPFSRGMISSKEIVFINTALLSSMLALAYSWFPKDFLLFFLFALNSTLYSMLFKRMPLMDLASHFVGFYSPFLFPALILGLPPYLLFFSAITFFAISTIGELDNQRRDLKYDRKTGVRSTMVVLGNGACDIIYYLCTFLIFASVVGVSIAFNSFLPFLFLPLLCMNFFRKLKNTFLGSRYDRIFLAYTLFAVVFLFAYLSMF